jgi:fructuronate reductase
MLPAAVRRPAYTPAQHGVGIAHLGLGAFHRAHQACYIDEALAGAGGDWRIAGISCRSPAVRDQLQPQAGLYSVVEKSAAGCSYRVVGSIAVALVAPENPAAAVELLALDSIRIISLTITEKGYQADSPELRADQADPTAPPRSAIGLLAAALRQRQRAGGSAPTLLCCDNLRDNGHALRRVLVEHARLLDGALARWIEQQVRFPCTMVDRIVPATTAADLAAAEQALGLHDAALVATEPFTQWVIEDDFSGQRPALELAGVQLVRDVRPFELAKLRLLNGSHSTLAYAGSLLGHTFVHEAIGDADLLALVRQLMSAELAPTLATAPGLDLPSYQQALLARFANPALQHRLRQIAMDGSQKLPQRLLTPLHERLQRGAPVTVIAFAVAAWMRYVTGSSERGESYTVDDPLAAQLAAAVQRGGDRPEQLVGELLGIRAIFGDELPRLVQFRRELVRNLSSMFRRGTRHALRELLASDVQ